ncbi:IS66 family transposase zinc-finger binding domain-containing protein [Aliiroseovarius crassostreae]|uniref:IS66 family transposase zinc-finger binding domain-containing protein n=1 Tax=Aliiroseovarius crassostreae TaxID=154981 RepID=UPI000ABA362C|nr:IS66 family transposase zinc-finger binding domain-containing protein [Aliiroseovarius crassostreae]
MLDAIKSLPDDPAEDCNDCGGPLRQVGEDVTEELEYIPGRFVVRRIIRPI